MSKLLAAFKLPDPGPALLLMSGHAATHWMTGVFYILLPFVREDYGFSYLQVGLLLGAFEAGVFVCSLASGPLVDMTGRRVVFQVLALVVGGLAMAALSVSSNFVLFGLMAALIGGATQFWHAPATAFLSFYYTSNWGYVVGIHGMGANVGEAIGPLIAGVVIASAGWQMGTLVPAAASLLTALMLFILLLPKDTPSDGKKAEGLTFRQYFDGFMGLLKNFGVMTLCVMMGVRSTAQLLVRLFVPLYMRDVMGASASLIGMVYAIMHVGGMIANPMGGLASDRFGRKRSLGRCVRSASSWWWRCWSERR